MNLFPCVPPAYLHENLVYFHDYDHDFRRKKHLFQCTCNPEWCYIHYKSDTLWHTKYYIITKIYFVALNQL